MISVLFRCSAQAAGLALWMSVVPCVAADVRTTSATPGAEVFAVVGGTTITWQEYQAAFSNGMRQKYYHARPPEREVAQYQREVGDRLVNRLLLHEEAKRRGIGPDRDVIKRTVEGYDKRYANSAQWKDNRDKMLPPLIAELEIGTTVDSLEKRVRDVAQPTRIAGTRPLCRPSRTIHRA